MEDSNSNLYNLSVQELVKILIFESSHQEAMNIIRKKFDDQYFHSSEKQLMEVPTTISTCSQNLKSP